LHRGRTAQIRGSEGASQAARRTAVSGSHAARGRVRDGPASPVGIHSTSSRPACR
jgi:hypothetical protein